MNSQCKMEGKQVRSKLASQAAPAPKCPFCLRSCASHHPFAKRSRWHLDAMRFGTRVPDRVPPGRVMLSRAGAKARPHDGGGGHAGTALGEPADVNEAPDHQRGDREVARESPGAQGDRAWVLPRRQLPQRLLVFCGKLRLCPQ